MVLKNYNLAKLFAWDTLKAGFVKNTPSSKYDMRIVENKYKEKDTRVLFKFRDEGDLDQWFTVDDNMNGGRSVIELATSKGGRLHMKGTLDGTPSYYNSKARPWDGVGFAGIRSYPFKKVWNDFEIVDTPIDLNLYHQLELRVRGDGRTYRVQFHFQNYAWSKAEDATNIWVAHLYTRGGPYWERVKIPFNRFYSTKKGMLARNFHRPIMGRFSAMSIFPHDNIPGDFSLEVDSIRALVSLVDEDMLWGPENHKYEGNKSLQKNEELFGKYRPSRVYSKHDHILY